MKLLNGILSVLHQALGGSLRGYCQLETNDDNWSFAASDGSLVSLIRVDGARQIIGRNELAEIVDGARQSFAPYLQRPGHAISVWFSRDPSRAAEVIEGCLRPARRQAQVSGLMIDDLFAEREQRLPARIAWEGYYFVLWTRPSLLTRFERGEAAKMSKAAFAKAPAYQDGQWPLRAIDYLRERHSSFLESMVRDLDEFGITAEKVPVHEALATVRAAMYPGIATSGWRPLLVGDRVPARMPKADNDASSVVWPSIQDQTLIGDAEVLSPYVVRLGDHVWGGIDMAIGPEEVNAFSRLMDRLLSAGDRLPWRINFLVEGGGLQAMGLTKTLASLLAWANDDNKRINQAVRNLKAFEMDGATVVRMRVSMATWAPVAEMDKVKLRMNVLLRAMESWGNCQGTMLVGDPLEAVMSSALGLHCASTAPSAAAPLEDVAAMLPWQRAASPWRDGAVMFRTPDEKPWPYQPGSSKQTTWVDIVIAPPGRGKSVLANSINLACCLAPRGKSGGGPVRLPHIAIIDIGPSSAGLISLLRESLPLERRHEAAYYRLQMRPEYAINPFDTQLGCRTPLPTEREFLVNFLSLLCTPPDARAPYDGVVQMIGLVIDEVYRIMSDKVTPKAYERGIDPLVDRVIERHALTLPDRTTWWEVIDLLFEAGLPDEAGLAQRHAMPLLADLAVAASTRAIDDIFGNGAVDPPRAPTGETISQAFQRMIGAILREYPILARPTRFDLSGARVVALDLDEVAPRGGSAGERRTAIMYMLARHAVARSYFLNEEIVPLFPERYRTHHAARIREIREEAKRIQFDEFHRTAPSPAVRAQVLADIREGRKWAIQICLISQLLTDIDEAMIEQATGVWILGAGQESTIDDIVRKFDLNESCRTIMRRHLNGPAPDGSGAPLLAVLTLKNGRYSQYLFNMLGPIELWAMSTTAEDAQIRSRLYERLGPDRARRILADVYPGGSAKPDVERRVARLAERGLFDTDAESGVVDEIVSELIEREALVARSLGKAKAS